MMPGTRETEVDPPNGSSTEGDDPWGNVPDTGRHLIMSLPPNDPDSTDMAKWVASVENRLRTSQGGGGGGGRNSDPIPKFLLKTKGWIEFIKFAAATVVAIGAIGWMGHEYVSRFATKEEHEEAQENIEHSIDEVGDKVRNNIGQIDNLRLRGIRIELEQHNTNDQLEAILELQTASTRRERQAAKEYVQEIETRVRRRSRLMGDERALRRVLQQSEDNPLAGLDL